MALHIKIYLRENNYVFNLQNFNFYTAPGSYKLYLEWLSVYSK